MIFRLAQPEDDAALRRLMRETVLPGHIRMTYAREPSFFAGLAGGRRCNQVVVLEDKGRIAGVGCRSIWNLYVNGKPQCFGYLSGLRLLPGVRGTAALARGYEFLKELHGDNRCPAYLTTIIEGNRTARRVLTSGRAGLPSYNPLGKCLTRVYPVRVNSRGHSVRCPNRSGMKIISSEAVDEAKLWEFLGREGARRQFFPVCRQDSGGGDIVDAIGASNLFTAMQGDEIIGILGLWDQNAVRQYIVDGYGPLLGLARPFVNMVLRGAGLYGLPRAGRQLRTGFAALACVVNDDPEVYRALFRVVRAKAGESGIQQLAAGMHADDPLNAALRGCPHVTYRSRLYLVSWSDTSRIGLFDGAARAPYLEIGLL